MIEATATLQSVISVTAQIVSIQTGGCADVTEQVNGTTIGTAASGSTNNQEIVNSGGTPVGTAANPSVVSDSTIRNRSNSPTWSDTVKAEGTYTLEQVRGLDSDGVTPLLADYRPESEATIITCTPCASPPSVSLAASATTTNIGNVITLTATASDFQSGDDLTYTFFVIGRYEGIERVVQVNDNTYDYLVPFVGTEMVCVTVEDESGNTAVSSITLDSTWSGFDDAAVLNGTTQYFQTNGNDFQSIFSSSIWCMNLWVKPDSLSNSPVLFASSDGQEFVQIESNRIYVRWGNSLRTYTGVTIPTGSWSMITVVKPYVGNVMAVYLNGVEVSTFTGTVASNNGSAKSVFVGKYISGSFHLDGNLDELTVMVDHVPNPAEILTQYNGGSGNAPTVLDKYPDWWLRFNGNGNDSSGNGYDTTAYNGVTYTAH